MKKIASLLDDTDIQIIELLEKSPYLSHVEIAKSLRRSQPAIGARIAKLIETGFLSTQIGTDFQKNKYFNLIFIQMETNKPELLFDMATRCPFVINILKTTGEYNLNLFMACSDLKRLDRIIDVHFRNKTFIRRLNTQLITETVFPFVLPIKYSVEEFDKADDKCASCSDACFTGVLHPKYNIEKIPSQTVEESKTTKIS